VKEVFLQKKFVEEPKCCRCGPSRMIIFRESLRYLISRESEQRLTIKLEFFKNCLC